MAIRMIKIDGVFASRSEPSLQVSVEVFRDENELKMHFDDKVFSLSIEDLYACLDILVKEQNIGQN